MGVVDKYEVGIEEQGTQNKNQAEKKVEKNLADYQLLSNFYKKMQQKTSFSV